MGFSKSSSFFLLAILLNASYSLANNVQSYQSACHLIASSISPASQVFYPTSATYLADIEHWADSSTLNSTCSVEPGTADDVAKILKIVGQTRTPFAIKGGGHAINQGFSSTIGVQIAMTRISNLTYNAAAQTVDVGAGLIWDEVFAYLEPYNVNVVGGRISGVGVAGFCLGGGYSWKTNQYGLALDNIVAYDLVLPNGTFTTVTANNADLFFGLKGGFNNFGIVTKFVLKTYPQTQVWGGSVVITSDNFDQLRDSVANFAATVTDPKAALIPTYNYAAGQVSVILLVFYDAPTYPNGIFDELMSIPSDAKNISTRSFISLINSAPGLTGASSGARRVLGAGMSTSILEYTAPIIDAIVAETEYWGNQLSNSSALFISYDVEPFLTTLFSHGNNTAYPPDRSRGLLPINLFYGYESEQYDTVMHNAIVQSASNLGKFAISQGQQVAGASIYANYAVADVPLQAIYGSNVARLMAIKQKYDPQNVMGLAGGYKF